MVGATYTVLGTDFGKIKSMGATATTVTLANLVTASAGQRIDFISTGGPITFVLGGGSTWLVPPTPSAITRAKGSFATAVATAIGQWALTGDLA